jgi:hypothetical protein
VKRKAPEQALQQQVAQYLDIVLKPPAFWTAIAHGGGGLMRGKINKGMGMKAGIPDILILSPFRRKKAGCLRRKSRSTKPSWPPAAVSASAARWTRFGRRS